MMAFIVLMDKKHLPSGVYYFKALHHRYCALKRVSCIYVISLSTLNAKMLQ